MLGQVTGPENCYVRWTNPRKESVQDGKTSFDYHGSTRYVRNDCSTTNRTTTRCCGVDRWSKTVCRDGRKGKARKSKGNPLASVALTNKTTLRSIFFKLPWGKTPLYKLLGKKTRTLNKRTTFVSLMKHIPKAKTTIFEVCGTKGCHGYTEPRRRKHKPLED